MKRFLIIIIFCMPIQSECMMQKLKVLISRTNEKQKISFNKLENAVIPKLAPDLITKLQKHGKKIIIGGTVVGYLVGYAVQPTSCATLSGILCSTLSGGELLGLYNMGNLSLFKMITHYSGVTYIAGSALALCLPTGWLICQSLPITTALIGTVFGYLIYKKK